MIYLLEKSDMTFWFIISVMTFILSTIIIIIMLKILTKKFNQITNQKKDNK